MNINILKTKKEKRYLIALLLAVIVGIMSQFSIVVNHYKHNLSAPFTFVLVAYIVYLFFNYRRYLEPKIRVAISVAVGVVAIVIWASALKTPTNSAYLGSELIIKNDSKDSKQIEMVTQIDQSKHKAILYLNPNCKVCQESIPEILNVLDTQKWSRVAFVDTTRDFGRSLSKQNEVERVPSYSDLDGFQVGRLAYNTRDGVEYYQTQVTAFHVLVSSNE